MLALLSSICSDLAIKPTPRAQLCFTATHISLLGVTPRPLLLVYCSAPTLATATRSVPENSVVGTVVSGGAIACVDQDNDALTYSIDGGTPFNVNPSTGVLTVASAVLDYESQPSYAVAVTCADPSGASVTNTYTINVLDVAEPPVYTRSCPVGMTFREDLTPNSNLDTPVAASDPDRGTVLVYSIRQVIPAAAASRFKVDSLTGQLAIIGRFDSEASPPDRNFTVVVGVTDTTFAVNCSVKMGILDVDEAPEFPNLNADITLSVNENSPINTLVSTLVAVDPEGRAVTYALQTLDIPFTLASNGQLRVSDDTQLDKEGPTPQFKGVVRATDPGGLYNDVNIIINVLDVQEPPVIQDSNVMAQELSTAGTRIGSPLPARDPDVGQKITWVINPVSQWVQIDNIGQLSLKKLLPLASTMGNFSITVVVTDNGSPQMSSDFTYLVTVLESPIRNNPPVLTLGSLTISEFATTGNILNISRNASDPDGHPVTLAFGGADASDGSLPFSLNNGMLTLTAAVDYETISLYQILIVATDSPSPVNGTELLPMSTSATITINIKDENENCIWPGTSAITVAVDENSAIGTIIVPKLRTTDPDNTLNKTASNGNSAITYTISSGNTGSVFSIASLNDANASQVAGARITSAKYALNFELINAYNLDITAKDGGGLTCTQRVNVAVNDKNDPPIVNAPASVSFPENTAVGSKLGAPLTATDEDGHAVGWSIAAASNLGNVFGIDSSGQLSLLVAVDYENKSRYDITVQASDGNGGLTSVTITMAVTDVPESPVYTGNLTYSLAENAAKGALVFKVTAYDPDIGDTLSYAILSGNVRDAFVISRASGDITVNTPAEVDFETRTSYTLEIVVTDTSGLSTRAVVTLNIINLVRCNCVAVTCSIL